MLLRTITIFSLVLWLAVGFYAAGSFHYLWDGNAYYVCLRNGLDAGIFSGTFNCLRHLSLGYMAPLAILTQGSQPAMHLVNFALLALGGFYFVKLVKAIPFSNIKSWPEAMLVFSIFVWNPIFLANCFNLGLDFPLAIFLIALVACLFSRNYLFAAGFAVLLCFSKETGLVIYLYLLSLFLSGLIFHKISRPGVRNIAAVLLPLLLYIIYLPRYLTRYEDSSWWIAWNYYFGEDKASSVTRGFAFNFLDNVTLQRTLFNIFALQFNWIWSAIIITALVGYIYSIISRREKIEFNKPNFFYGLLFIGSALILSVYRDVNAPRYIMTALPWFYLIGYLCLFRFAKSFALRKSVLSIVLVLTISSNFLTIDPISRAYYGTFKFGDYSLLKMRTRPNECCGHGKNQLVYNLQYHQLSATYLAIERYNLDGLPIVVEDYAGRLFCDEDFMSYSKLDDKKHAVCDELSRFLTKGDLPEEIIFANLPNINNEKSLAFLRGVYRNEHSFEVEGPFAGYNLNAIKFSDRR